MTNVTFFIGTVKLGGTEAKLVRNFLPALKRRGKLNPKLLLLRKDGEFLDQVPADIEMFCLNEGPRTALPQMVVRLRRLLEELDSKVIVTCMWYPALVAWAARKLAPGAFVHVVHDTVTMSECIRYELSKERLMRMKLYLIRRAYADADALVGNSRGVTNDFLDFGMRKDKVHMIYNPLNREMIRAMAGNGNHDADRPLVVAAGRLVYQKGFDILLRAFRKVRDRTNSRLLIIGDGVLKQELINLTDTLGLRDDVTFSGFQQNPWKLMKRATVFCHAARYEGFPNVVLEAMTLGVPVVTTDCHAGPAEITGDGKYGILVPPEDPDSLAREIINVLLDGRLRDSLSALALRRADDYGFDSSLEAYERLLRQE